MKQTELIVGNFEIPLHPRKKINLSDTQASFDFLKIAKLLKTCFFSLSAINPKRDS